MIKAIIFDCFGVLTTDGWLPFKQKYFGANQALHDDASDLNKQSGAGIISQIEFYDRIAGMTGISPLQAQTEIDASVPNTPLFDYIVAKLKPTYKIALLSNAGDNYLERLFTAEQVALFDEVALSYEMGTIKPDGRAYTTILDRLGVQADEAVFIDDHERHCEGARDMGIRAIQYEDYEQCVAELEAILAEPAI